MDEELRRRWHDLVGLLGVDEVEAGRVLQDLARRHGEPRRVYHSLAHVRHVLDVIIFLRRREPVDDPIAVQLAAWFHDAVQQPGGREDEARSAELAAEVLAGWGVAAGRVEAVTALVLATADHRPEPGTDAAVVVDADLAVLAADPVTYDVYRRAVRVEHAHLDDDAWRAGRAAFLRRLLDRPAIFTTPTMRERGEATARTNLGHELARLSGGGDHRPRPV